MENLDRITVNPEVMGGKPWRPDGDGLVFMYYSQPSFRTARAGTLLTSCTASTTP
jgi:hypothetical protein